jgi:hypothetical protein
LKSFARETLAGMADIVSATRQALWEEDVMHSTRPGVRRAIAALVGAVAAFGSSAAGAAAQEPSYR